MARRNLAMGGEPLEPVGREQRLIRVADVELSEGSERQLDIEHGRRRVEFPKQMKGE
jgi:hypothetical protein